MKKCHYKWWSPRLERDMELLVFGERGARVMVFPTRCGRFYDYEDFGMLQSVRERIEAGHLQLYCLDSVDSEALYAQKMPGPARIARHQRYEDYVLAEVLPLSEELNRSSYLMAHGCSLGGYHAVNITLRHPQLFKKAVALSGRFDLTRNVEDFRDLFEGYRDPLVEAHTPPLYLRAVHERSQQSRQALDRLRQLELVLAVGEQDPFMDDNRQLACRLGELGIAHALYAWDGRAHAASHWCKMVQLYL
jgi:esterase/lipase superfamily enzyme